MPRQLIGLFAAGALLFAGWPSRAAEPPAAPAATASAEIPRISAEFSQVDLVEAMAQLAEATGIDFVVAPGATGQVTARFIDEPLDKVLRLIGLSLGVEVRLVEGIFLLSPPAPDAPAPGARPSPATGAGALLPGAVAEAPATGAGEDLSLVGDPAAPSTASAPVSAEIPVANRPASEIARALGGAAPGADTRAYRPGWPVGTPTAGTPRFDPYRNLPPEARVTRNGTIMMPNGTTILPSGVVILPNGTVVQPGSCPPYITVPYGTTPSQLQQMWGPYYRPAQGTLQVQVNGVRVGVSQYGQGYLQPPPLRINGQTVVQLPGVTLGGTPPASTAGPLAPPIPYPPANRPTIHYGQRPGNWFYGLPPDWHFIPPAR